MKSSFRECVLKFDCGGGWGWVGFETNFLRSTFWTDGAIFLTSTKYEISV